MLLALIMLTALDGSPIWVESTQIVIIRPARENRQCGETVGAGIRVGAATLCVRETPYEIEKRVREAK